MVTFISIKTVGKYVGSDLDPLLLFLSKTDRINFDTEYKSANPHDDKLILMQIGNEEEQFVIDRTYHGRFFRHPYIRKRLEEITICGVNLKVDIKFLIHEGIRPTNLEDAMLVQICLYNGLFDIAEVKDSISESDTKVAGVYGLAPMALYYLGLEVNKEEQKSFMYQGDLEAVSERQITYAAIDAQLPSQILDMQKKTHRNYPYCKNVIALENKFLYALTHMEYNGITLDLAKWPEVKDLCKLELDAIVPELSKSLADLSNQHESLKDLLYGNRLLGKEKAKPKDTGWKKPTFKTRTKTNSPDARYIVEYENRAGEKVIYSKINWSSNLQKKEILGAVLALYGLKLPVTYDKATKTEKISTSRSTLIKFQDQVPLVEILIRQGILESIKTKFADVLQDFVHPVTGKIHTDIFQIVSTGRQSSNKPNLQQIPSKTHKKLASLIRSCFVADEGHVLTTADYSNIELRILCELSKEPVWIKAFNEGVDLHSLVASRVFGADIKEVKTKLYNKVPMRDIAKTINFGLAYGMTFIKLAAQLNISNETAKGIIDKYQKELPVLVNYLEESGKLGSKYFMSSTPAPWYRPRFYDREAVVKWTVSPHTGQRLEVISDKTALAGYERQAKNQAIQGCNADIVKAAIFLLQKEIDKNPVFADCRLRLSVHDEIVSSSPIEIKDLWKEKVREIMVGAATKTIKCVPVLVDISQETFWTK